MAKDWLTRSLETVFGAPGQVSDPLTKPVGYYRRTGDAGKIYGRFTYRSEASVGGFPRQQRFEAVGDTLLCDEIVGSEAVYVRIGEEGNPWLRIEEGDELYRRFDCVYVTTGGAPDSAIPNLFRSVTEATFVHSWGRTKRKGIKQHGFRRGFKAFRGSATTVEQSVFAPLAALAPNVALVFGKRGGTLVIRNRDLSNTLLVRYGVVGSLGAEDYWELFPGEAHSVALANRIQSRGDTVIVACAAGTCNYGFLVSAFDIDRADIDQTVMPGI